MLGDVLQITLQQDGHAVDWVQNGFSAGTALRAQTYDMVLLDLGLPRMDGISVLKELRDSGNRTPVIVITARDALSQRVAGLDAGADDYVLKPFDLEELFARIRAVARRMLSAGRASNEVTVGTVRLNMADKRCTLAGRPVDLTGREFALLEVLMQRPGVLWSRRDIEDRLFDWGHSVESNAVEVYVSQLRRKLGRHFIRTYRGLGYSVSVDDTDEPR